jgi:hypothetical protein
MRLSLVAGERPAKTTTVLIQELEAAGVHVPGISPPPSPATRRLRLVDLDELAAEADK